MYSGASTSQTLTGRDVLFCYNASGRSWTCIVVQERMGFKTWNNVLPLNYARKMPTEMIQLA
ncbi:hypothetical protein EFM55_00865 [Lactiplantibacillus pentosus]|nr:hypothetical protein [Lactiplantibacillus pentosus]